MQKLQLVFGLCSATLFVPEESDIVMAKSKNGQEVVYRSTAKPIRPPDMKLAVLVNKGTKACLFSLVLIADLLVSLYFYRFFFFIG